MKIQEVIKILFELSVNINLKINLLQKFDSNEDLINQISSDIDEVNFKQILEIQVREYCIISICSYLDEYNDYLNVPKIENCHHDRVVSIRKILKPFFKEINRNYNLKDYRNQLLAHNFRDKQQNEKSLISGEIYKEYSFPKNTFEFMSVFEIIKLINTILIEEFRDILPKGLLTDKVIIDEKLKFSREIKQFHLADLKSIFEEFIKNKRKLE